MSLFGLFGSPQDDVPEPHIVDIHNPRRNTGKLVDDTQYEGRVPIIIDPFVPAIPPGRALVLIENDDEAPEIEPNDRPWWRFW